ncbi:hypothetical protein [Chakrabartyella piscis]|uniref:hypothetical protein n=1 Tax=Chakrabartyella piscis TaxID=2918914 RepID=UPI002958CB97|nr:hypothetical protein [Chakrabartyella piscis]
MEMRSFPIHNDLAFLVEKLQAQTIQKQENTQENIILFFSFDIVNSTSYKATNKENWMDAISEIIRHIISGFSNSSLGGFRFWKTLGDEIIYTKEVFQPEDIVDTLETIYANLCRLNQEIASGLLCDVESAKVLGIKATAWVAHTSTSGNVGDNIFTEYLINDNRRQTEYIGPDIDIGFRVASYSICNHLVVSFDLAALLLRFDTAQKKRVHIFGYKQLKGVWEGRLYPIIMFNGDCNANIICELEKEHASKKATHHGFLQNLKDWTASNTLPQ